MSFWLECCWSGAVEGSCDISIVQSRLGNFDLPVNAGLTCIYLHLRFAYLRVAFASQTETLSTPSDYVLLLIIVMVVNRSTTKTSAHTIKSINSFLIHNSFLWFSFVFVVAVAAGFRLHIHRYYRLWIYTCNAVLLVAVIIFCCIAGKVLLADYRRLLVNGLNLGQPSFLYAYLALLVQSGKV